mmetsp:Transcript_100951/g.200546  ORF Transcript_100951/g.200546 Transcript_100951/m.200546 type:complete len:145 (+) Transcript_100951:99-533(+)
MSFIDPGAFNPEALSGEDDFDVNSFYVPKQRPQLEPGGGLRQFGVRFAGAIAGAVLAWLALPPGLDFSLVAASVLTAACAVAAALATESLPPLMGSSMATLQTKTGGSTGTPAATQSSQLHRLPGLAVTVGQPSRTEWGGASLE